MCYLEARMNVIDLGILEYHAAWQRQTEAHELVQAGGEETLFLVEHPPVITLGRQADKALANVLFSQDQLDSRGVSVVESDRGGNVTFHGPGQLVVYPIIRLNDYRLSVGAYVRFLEDVVIETLSHFGIAGELDKDNIGVWTRDEKRDEKRDEDAPAAKICALGVRVKRGVTLHGLALNVSTDLKFFQMIVPCGINLPVTSIRQILDARAPTMDEVKVKIVEIFRMKQQKIRWPGA